MKSFFAIAFFILTSCVSPAQQATPLKDLFNKVEVMVPMRDGIKLFTAIYVPKTASEKLPFLLQRTPYSCNPYGEVNFPRRLGPSALFAAEKYIHVMQDVRGRYRSEGKFEEMTPHGALKTSAGIVDESTDCFDTVEWLLSNIQNNNGKAGIYGISYPGFYASAALPGAHPAMVAASPQAPVTDEFEGDDAYHNGAFFLMDNFNFLTDFDHPRVTPWTSYPSIFETKTDNAYDFFLQLGPIKNANDRYYLNKSKIWNEYLQHDTKDAYWQSRNIRPALKNIKPAVLTVGGWYDAEDLFGALQTYKAIETQSPNNNSTLIMGPWTHGGWARSDWSSYATINFNSNTSKYFQEQEFAFFNYYLKGKGKYAAAEATVFETGSNEWKEYDTWPPKAATNQQWFLHSDNKIEFQKPDNKNGILTYTSDPANPVPYISPMGSGRNNEYMVADQRFAAERKDVLVFESSTLTEALTLSGPILADLFVSTTGTDADFIVKVIDVLPADAVDQKGKSIAGMQRLVRAEVLRGKFRNSFVTPEAFVPNKVTPVQVKLNDVAHRFLKGHKIMVQIQSTWFPLVDRNPQRFMQIPKASDADFQKSNISLFCNEKFPSSLNVMVLK